MSLASKLSLTVLGLAATFLALALAIPHEAFAAEGSKIAKNVGSEAKAWGTALIGGGAAIAGLPALMKREVQGAGIVAVVAFVIGGFVFAEGAVKDVIQTLWKTVS